GGASDVDELAAAKLLERYAVPSPDDLTVERVWHRLARPDRMQSGDRGRRVLAWVLVPAASLAVIAGLGLWAAKHAGRPPSGAPHAELAAALPPAELGAARGGVFFSRPAEQWQPGREGQVLAEGHGVRTDPSGRALLDVPGVAAVMIAAGTEVGLERLSGGTYLRLTRGSVIARVSKRQPSEPFVILTDRYAVKVVGTLFQVDQDASGRTAVAVREGTVEVSSADGHIWRVEAGQSWVSSDSERLGQSSIGEPVKALLEDGLRRGRPVDLDRELG